MNNDNLQIRLQDNYKKYEELVSKLTEKKEYNLVNELIEVYHSVRRLRYEQGAAMVREINNN